MTSEIAFWLNNMKYSYYLDNYIKYFFCKLFKLVGGKNVRDRLLSQIYAALLTRGSGFKSLQGSQTGKGKKRSCEMRLNNNILFTKEHV